MKKTLLSLLTASAALTAVAADEFNHEGIKYEVLSEDNKSVAVSGLVDKSGITTLVIPATVSYNDVSYDVVTIKQFAITFCPDLTTIILPESITSLEGSSLAYNKVLTSINLPDSLETIGSYAICSSALTEIIIPNSVKSIEQSAFQNSANMETVVLGKSITEIGEKAFYGCNKIKNVYSFAPEAPTCLAEAFHKVYLGSGEEGEEYCPITGYVLPGSIESYSGADNGWAEISEFSELGISFDAETIQINIDETLSLEPVLSLGDSLPIETTTWTSSDMNVVTVSEKGELTAISKGEAVVTLTITDVLGNEYSASVTVTVNDTISVESISSDSDATVEVYNLSGCKIADSVTGLPAGIYLVRIAGRTYKTAVK